MKRLVSILSILVLVLSCTERELDGPVKPDGQLEEKAVELNFGVVLPEMQAATKSFSENAITDLHAYVFDGNGYLVEHSVCSPKTAFEVSSSKTLFNVTMTQTSSPRYVHFVANCPVVVNDAAAYTEYDLIGSMSVSGTQDAYWQRIEFPNGIKAPEYDTDKDTQSRLTEIPMVRNYAKITVKIAENEDGKPKLENFEILGYQVVRVPDKGSVAPFNVNNIDFNGGFARYAEFSASTLYTSNPTYDDFTNNQKFVGISPSDAKFDDGSSLTDADLDNSSKYLYERNVIKEKENEPWVILKAKINGTATKYFKLILMDKDGNYYNILRNFEYIMSIHSVTEYAGYDSLQAALEGSPNNGNLSYMTETKNLLNISDGSHRLYVSEVEKTIVGKDPVYIYYKYEVQGSVVNNTDDVISDKSKVETGDVINAFYWETSDIPARYAGYAKLKIVPNKITTQKKQVITISDGNLSREITLWLQPPFDLKVECTPSEVLPKIGESVEVKLTLDSDLRESMFPLVFTIEAGNLSIYPDATKANNIMPVVSGKNITIVPSKNADTPVFQYEKTITWDEYYKGGTRNTEFSCYFKTNKAESASIIYVYNSYFGRKKCWFTNPGVAAPVDPNVYQLEISQPYVGLNQDANVSFEVSDDFNGDIIIDVVGLSQSDITSSTGIIEVKDDNIVYKPDGSGSQIVKFKTASELDDVTVTLRFGKNESIQTTQSRLKHNFNLKLDKETVGLTSEDLKVTFNMPVIETVEVSLVGLSVPSPEDDSRFSTRDGKVYFTPSATGPQEVTFMTTAYATDKTKSVSVTLSHEYFEPATATANRKKSVLTINSNTITKASGGRYYNDINLYIYTEGNQYDKPAGSVTMNDNGGISSGSVDVEYFVVTEKIYFQYTIYYYSYRASATIEELLDGGVTLNFSRN